MVYAYVANADYAGSGTISVIDTAAGSIAETITLATGTQPYAVAVSPDGTTAYITDIAGSGVLVIDTATSTVIATISVTAYSPEGIAVSPDGTLVYVCNTANRLGEGLTTVSVISTSTNTIAATITVGNGPTGVVFSPDGSTAYVANAGGSGSTNGTISVIDVANSTVSTTIDLAYDVFPYGLAITPDGGELYVTNGGELVVVIDTATNTVTHSITVGVGCRAIAITPNGSYAYAANLGNLPGDGSVSVISTSSHSVTTTITTGIGQQPGGISITPDGAHAYVTNSEGNTVSVISTSSNTVTATITSGTNPVSFGNFIQQVVPMSGIISRLRNGNFFVAQRGTSGTITAGTPAYSVDGWIISATGANVTWAQEGNQANYANGGLQITGASGNTNTTIQQRIEGHIVADMFSESTLTGGAVPALTFQIQIWNNTGASITPQLAIYYANALDNWSASTQDGTTHNLQSIPAGDTETVAYTWSPGSADYTNGISVQISVGALGASKAVQLRAADLRATPGGATGLNNTPPTPEQRPLPMELAFCQRYFNSTFGNGVAPAQNAGLSGALQAQPYASTAGALYTQWEFPVQMRANPSITTYNPANTNANWRDKTGSSDIVVSVDPDSAIGLSGVMIGSQTTTLTTGHRCYIHATASAEL